MGFTFSLLTKRTAVLCTSLVHVASGAAVFTRLLRRRVAFLHPTATCKSLFKPLVSMLANYTTSCFSKFYRYLKFLFDTPSYLLVHKLIT